MCGLAKLVQLTLWRLSYLQNYKLKLSFNELLGTVNNAVKRITSTRAYSLTL